VYSVAEMEVVNVVSEKKWWEYFPRGLEGGLVTKGEFRKGAHTAHGNHRSKTICRKNIGVCAFVASAKHESHTQFPIKSVVAFLN
jgi:hypothetical protein